jgi:transposase
MLYARQPTEAEYSELKRMTRRAIGRVSPRAHLILLSVQRHSVPELASLFAMSRATARLWIPRFHAYGPEGLYDDPRRARPRKVTPQVLECVVTMRQDDPQHAGYLATCWTVAMLGLALLHKLGVQLSTSALRVAWQAVGLRWRRPRLAMPSKVDPEKTRKQWVMAKAVVEAGPTATILYGDESRLQLLPLLRAMSQWVGQQVRVPTPGTNVTRVLFGALDIRTGRWVYRVRERRRKEDFMAFLEHLLEAYPTGLILLMVDHFSSHTADAMDEWLATHPRLQLYYLPTYCSHVNPVERIGLRLKNTLAADRLYGSMKLVLETTEASFRGMTPEQALGWAAA